MCRKLSTPIILTYETKEKILNAFINSSFRWRTAEGIATELGLDFDLVFNFLYFSEDVISAGRTNSRGEQLFANREKYYKELPTKLKIKNAITHKFH